MFLCSSMCQQHCEKTCLQSLATNLCLGLRVYRASKDFPCLFTFLFLSFSKVKRPRQNNYFGTYGCGLVKKHSRMSMLAWLLLISPLQVGRWMFIFLYVNDSSCSISRISIWQIEHCPEMKCVRKMWDGPGEWSKVARFEPLGRFLWMTVNLNFISYSPQEINSTFCLSNLNKMKRIATYNGNILLKWNTYKCIVIRWFICLYIVWFGNQHSVMWL